MRWAMVADYCATSAVAETSLWLRLPCMNTAWDDGAGLRKAQRSRSAPLVRGEGVQVHPGGGLLPGPARRCDAGQDGPSCTSQRQCRAIYSRLSSATPLVQFRQHTCARTQSLVAAIAGCGLLVGRRCVARRLRGCTRAGAHHAGRLWRPSNDLERRSHVWTAGLFPGSGCVARYRTLLQSVHRRPPYALRGECEQKYNRAK